MHTYEFLETQGLYEVKFLGPGLVRYIAVFDEEMAAAAYVNYLNGGSGARCDMPLRNLKR
jgi:hypothetical protein